MDDRIIAEKSLGEEIKATADYEERLEEADDTKLQEVLKHLIKEENEHREMLEDWLADHEAKMDIIKKAHQELKR